MDRPDRITIDPDVCLGQPTVRGIRFTVAFIVKMVNDGHSTEEILEWYPCLEVKDIWQAVEFERTHPCEA
jgi:uncharacterized protein (DUF433 family)